ncbi:MAG TPA: ABC transporter permease [Vicinamibacterales bacterium]|nr:ABC transporter permease [Vicinamibacterales bacterium]
MAVLRQRRDEQMLADEIIAHLDLLADEYRDRGLPDEEARAAARREFGGIDLAKERVRDQRGFMWLDALRQDVHYIARTLRRNPAFAVVAIATLALAIGANTAIFSVVDAVILRPLAYHDADRLVIIHEVFPHFGRSPVSANSFDEWRRSARSFERMAIIGGQPVVLTGSGEPERLQAARVSPDLFPMLGIHAKQGRMFVAGDNISGRDRVVLLGDDLWHRRFGGDPAIVGKRLLLNDQPYEVVGVLPASFHFPKLDQLFAIPMPGDRPQLWIPFVAVGDERAENDFACIARLRPNVSRLSALAEMNALQVALAARAPEKIDLAAAVEPLQEQITDHSRMALELLWVSVAIVLLIACVNITNILLSRVLTRRRELAIRAAVGASRGRLVRQMLVESLVLSMLAGAVGVLIAYAAVPMILAVAPVDVPRIEEAHIDASVLLFAVAVSATTGVLVGLLPAWRLGFGHLQPAIQLEARTPITGVGGKRMRAVLVTAEVALSTVCLVVAGLLLHSFVSVLQLDRGFDVQRIVTVDVSLSATRYSNRDTRAAFVRSALERVRAIPGVETAAFVNRLPLNGVSANSLLAAEGKLLPTPERPLADIRTVDAEYFHTLKIPLIAGRIFDDSDRHRSVALVSAAMAHRAWPGENALGKQFRLGADPDRLVEVIGVTGDVRTMTLEAAPSLAVYVPYWQGFINSVSFAIGTAAEPTAMSAALRTAVHQVDPEAPISAFRTMDHIVADAIAPRRFEMNLVLLFGTVAVGLAALGIYGVIWQNVVQRTSEIGVRLALGATRGAVVVMLLGDALRMVGGGLVIGVPLAAAAGFSLRALLFGVSPMDLPTFVAATALLIVVATAAAGMPAWRASRVNPVVALRHE